MKFKVKPRGMGASRERAIGLYSALDVRSTEPRQESRLGPSGDDPWRKFDGRAGLRPARSHVA